MNFSGEVFVVFEFAQKKIWSYSENLLILLPKKSFPRSTLKIAERFQWHNINLNPK